MTQGEREITAETAREIGFAIGKVPLKIEPGKADAEQVFMVYAGASGDIVRTAKACGIKPQEVATMADEGNWLPRISELLDLKKLDKYDDVGRALSRASNFVQANRWRIFLERVVRRFEEIPDEELIPFFQTFKVTKDGTPVMTGFSMRVLADISSALEKCHWLLYQSLLDAPADRTARKAAEKPDITGGESDIHARIARTLVGMGMKTVEQHGEVAHDAILPPVILKPTVDTRVS